MSELLSHTGVLTSEEALDRAADAYGVELQYWDIFGKQHFATAEVKRAILESMGVDCSSDESLRRAFEERAAGGTDRLLPPTIVLSEDAPVLEIAAPAAAGGGVVELNFRLEDGLERTMRFSLANAESADGSKRVRVVPLPLGYHKVTARLVAGGAGMESRVIVCPSRAYIPPRLANGGRIAGIGVSLYGVRSARNWGCGDLTELRAVIEWAANDLRASYIALNPLHALANRAPYNTSPYLPNCSYYRNFIYLDIEAVPEFKSSKVAQAALRGAQAQREIDDLRKAEYVEYEGVSRLKLRFLKALFRQFYHGEYLADTGRAQEFRKYVAREGAMLERFAI